MVAELAMNEQSLMVISLPALSLFAVSFMAIAPPLPEEFPMNRQCSIVAWIGLSFTKHQNLIAPPVPLILVVFPMKEQPTATSFPPHQFIALPSRFSFPVNVQLYRFTSPISFL